MDHEYAPIHGLDSYIAKSLALAYGEDHPALKEGRIAGAQSLSGTGSIRVGYEFLKDFFPNKDAEIYVPTPTWPVHKTATGRAGLGFKEYRYYNSKIKGFDYDGMREDL